MTTSASIPRAQRVWLAQARSDFQVFQRLRRTDVAVCHLLHYLQMATEKLAKAYLWRGGSPPTASHVGLVRFLRMIASQPEHERKRVATTFGVARVEDLDRWLRAMYPLASEIERLAPALARDAPNPEYPWPHDDPTHCPCEYRFAIWDKLCETPQGRKFLQVFLPRAIERFDVLA